MDKKYSSKIMRLSKGLDDQTHTHRNIGETCPCIAPVALGQNLSLRRRQRPMALVSWLTDLELLAQAADAKMEMETFSSEDLTWL